MGNDPSRPLRLHSARSVVAVAVLAFAGPARAQLGTDAARRALIEAARGASRDGDHARAIELATRAAAIHTTPSLRYFLAREHLSVGHAVEALALAGECVARARDDAEVPSREALLTRCEAVASEAEQGVARLTVRVPSPAPEGLRVTVAGEALSASLLDVAVPVAPGSVEVIATAPGRVAARATVTLVAGARDAVTLDLPLEPPPAVAPPPPPAPVVVLPAVVPPPPMARPAAPPTARRSRVAPSTAGPWVVGGLGLATLAAAGVLGGIALGAQADRDAACPSQTDCDPVAASEHHARYRDMALGANVAFGVGAALVVAGVGWWVGVHFARRRPAPVSASAAGLVLRW